MAIFFVIVWISITIPILLSLIFGLLEPIVTVDKTGISMIIIALLIGILDCYIGLKILNKFQSWLENRKRSLKGLTVMGHYFVIRISSCVHSRARLLNNILKRTLLTFVEIFPLAYIFK